MARFESPASVTAPTASPGASSNHGPVRRHSRTRRRSSPVLDSSGAQSTVSTQQEDSITELPENNHFGLGLFPRKALSSRSQLSKKAERLTTASIPVAPAELISPSEYKDAISPLPDKAHFVTTVSRTEYPTPASDAARQYSGSVSPLRSIFPRYDPLKPLSHQAYYPTALAQSPPAHHSPARSSNDSPTNERQQLKRYDSAVGLIDGYEHIPAAGHADLEALWKASAHDFPCEGRKVQFPLYQSYGSTSLAIGTSPKDIIYSLQKDKQPNQNPKCYSINKHCPTTHSCSPAAHITLPRLHSTTTFPERTTIFPESAAIHAVEKLSTFPQALATATFNPSASSPAAQHIAQETPSRIHQDYTCTLTCQSRSKDSSNNVSATYALSHPHLGHCPITVTKSPHSLANSTRIPGPPGQGKAKISLHHPTATPAALSAETLNLAFLDFGSEACVVDIPGLLALDSQWVIDTVISALIAVALAENDLAQAEEVTFEGPPKEALPIEAAKGKMRSRPKKNVGAVQRKRSKSRGEQGERKKNFLVTRRWEKNEVCEISHELSTPFPPPLGKQVLSKEEELPSFGRAVLGLVGMSFRGGFWIAKVGVKVAIKGVHAARESAAGPPC